MSLTQYSLPPTRHRSVVTALILVVAAMAVISYWLRPADRRTGDDTVCAIHMRAIGAAIAQYAKDHDALLPSDLDDLVRPHGTDPLLFTCPRQRRSCPTSMPGEEIYSLSDLDGQMAFLYCGRGLSRHQVGAHDVLLYERPGNHARGVWVLFGDGRLERVGNDEIGSILAESESRLRAKTQQP